MSGGCLQPKLNGGVAELERVEKEAVFEVEVYELKGELKVPVEPKPKLFNSTAEAKIEVNVAFIVQNKGIISFNESKPHGPRYMALHDMAREFVQTRWSRRKWDRLKTSPDEEITQDFFYESLAEFLIPRIETKLVLFKYDKVPPHLVFIQMDMEKQRHVYATFSPRFEPVVLGPIKTCLPKWLQSLPSLNPTRLLYFQMDLVVPPDCYKNELKSIRKFVSLLVEGAFLSQNLDLLEINLGAALTYLSGTMKDKKVRDPTLKCLIPYLLHNRCGGTIVIRGLLKPNQTLDDKLDAVLVEALGGKQFPFRFYKAFSQVGGEKTQNISTRCFPKPGAIVTAPGDALLSLGKKKKVTDKDLIDTFFPDVSTGLKTEMQIVYRSLHQDVEHQAHAFYPPDVNMTELQSVRFRIESIPEMKPLIQIEGGRTGICLTSHMKLRGQPKLGPNMYMGLAGAATGVHLDGNGPCHAWHVSCRGYSMVAMFSDKMEIENCEKLVTELGGKIGASPQDNQEDVAFPTEDKFREYNRTYNAQGTRFMLGPGDMVVIKAGAPHLFVKADMEACLPVAHSLHKCHQDIKKPLSAEEKLRNRLSLGIACDGLFVGLDTDSNHQEIERLLHLEANFVVKNNLEPLCRLRSCLAYGALDLPLVEQKAVAGRSYWTYLIATITEDMTAFDLIKQAFTPSCKLKKPTPPPQKKKRKHVDKTSSTGDEKVDPDEAKLKTKLEPKTNYLKFELKYARQKDRDEEPILCNCCQRDLPFLVFATMSRCEPNKAYETHFCSKCILRHVLSETMEDQFIKKIYPCMADAGEVCQGKITGIESAISHLVGAEFPCTADIYVQTRGCDPPLYIEKLIDQLGLELEKELKKQLETFSADFKFHESRYFDLPVDDRMVCNVASNG